MNIGLLVLKMTAIAIYRLKSDKDPLVKNQCNLFIILLLSLQSPFISQFLPTLLLWTFAALLPLLVVYSSYYFEFHWTRTTLNHTIMRKTFVFLLIMVLVLPSLGLAR